MTSRRRRTDEHTVVHHVVLHTDSVAEHRATSEGDDGSIASTATVRPLPRRAAISALVSVDFPTPGEPVIPTTCASCGSRPAIDTSAPVNALPRSTSVSARASALLDPELSSPQRSGIRVSVDGRPADAHLVSSVASHANSASPNASFSSAGPCGRHLEPHRQSRAALARGSRRVRHCQPHRSRHRQGAKSEPAVDARLRPKLFAA